MGWLLSPFRGLLGIVGLVLAVLLGLALLTVSLIALSLSLTVLIGQCVLGVLVLGGFACTVGYLALRQPIVQALLLERFKIPSAPLPEQASPQVWLPPPTPVQQSWPEPPAAESIEPVTVVRQPLTHARSRRPARTIDAQILKDWGW